ncbi:MAG: aminodeoxychorismate synthase component I [Gammaproteobacteria bacterium]|nr:aminodeoxychorismate synthase component I [Gammaproteobacteria bacterium]
MLDDFPDLTRLHQRDPARYPHLLESVAHGTRQARYDILFAFPGEVLTLHADGRLTHADRSLAGADFLSAFERHWQALALPAASAPELPFRGGWFVFLSYELAPSIEPSVTGIGFEPGLPVARATRCPAAIIRDRAHRRTYAVCEAGQADTCIPPMVRDIQVAAPGPPNGAPALTDPAEDPPERFLDGVARVLDYIRAGDVFQVNLSRAWRARLARPAAPVELYRRLCAANPAPFAGLMSLGEGEAVVSSSPERLVSVRGRRISTRPIAGTYPRSPDPEQDRVWSRELLRHPKERAEHVMLLDLERNDLGRVCRAGTVRVGELMTLESYRHVHHIVSEVSGELRGEATPAAVLRAVFPGGTITGCPKVRCMQIIAELEQAARGAYTGSFGYINRDGDMDFNILIRTITQRGRDIDLRAGAGIVADSDPQRELHETRAKAKGMLAALGWSQVGS